jgi:hypothetical protein
MGALDSAGSHLNGPFMIMQTIPSHYPLMKLAGRRRLLKLIALCHASGPTLYGLLLDLCTGEATQQRLISDVRTFEFPRVSQCPLRCSGSQHSGCGFGRNCRRCSFR